MLEIGNKIIGMFLLSAECGQVC